MQTFPVNPIAYGISEVLNDMLILVVIFLATLIVSASTSASRAMYVAMGGSISLTLVLLVTILMLFYCIHRFIGAHSYLTLSEKEITFKRGKYWTTTVYLQAADIKHFSTHASPIDKYFKTTTIEVYTAGSDKADMKIPNIPMRHLQEILAFLRVEKDA